MPALRIQPLCSWTFAGTPANQIDGQSDDSSPFFQCGYGYGVGGPGNPSSGTAAFTFCTYDFDACISRLGNAGAPIPILQDQFGNHTGRFGGFRFVPSLNVGLQRPYVSGKWEQIINVNANDTKYGDAVPLAYGTTWVTPPVMGVWGDGNYTGIEVLLSFGQINRVKKVVVNGHEVAQIADEFSTQPNNYLPSDATVSDFKNGFWKTVNNGQRNGTPSPQPGWQSLGDPYGSTCAIYIEVLRQIASEGSLPQVQVLVEGQQLRVYTNPTTFTKIFTQNPAWILLDVLTWATWRYQDIDLQSFIDAAQICDQQINFFRMDGIFSNVYSDSGNPPYAKYSVGFCIQQRTSIGELVRGLRNAMKAMLFFDYQSGKLKLVIKQTIASQQPNPIPGSNFNTPVPSVTVAGVSQTGYVAYSFDASNITKSDDGRLSLNIRQLTNQDAASKASVTFQNRENSFSQDSATIVDTEDVARLGFEVASGNFTVVGPQTFDHVRRVVLTWMAENYRGNARLDYTGSAIGDTGGTLIAELETTVKAIHLVVGHIVMLSDLQHGLVNQPFRIIKVQPSVNFETCKVTMTFHNDNWFQDSYGQANQPKYSRVQTLVTRPPFALRPGIEQPIVGDAYYGRTDLGFGVQESFTVAADKSVIAQVLVTTKVPVNSFPTAPGRPKLELAGAQASGGGYPPSTTYYAALSALQGVGTSSLMSALSDPVPITLDGSHGALSFSVQHWPDNPSGYFAFAGDDPFDMSYQAQSTANPSSVVLTNNYNKASWGPPDEAASNFRWEIFRIRHSGVWGASVLAVSSTTIQVPVFPGWGFLSNQWAGRVLSVLGIATTDASPEPFVPIANFPVVSNTSDTMTLSAGDPTTCVQGASLKAGDVVVMRSLFTFGQDSVGNYFEDLLWVNALNPLFDPWQVSGATNASPIVLTIAVPTGEAFPFSNGDTVVAQGVQGNSAANGGWVAANVDAVAGTLELSGSTGSGAYTLGGTVAKQDRGLKPNDEVGAFAFIIAGTGRGTGAKIKYNTSTRIYISGDWPIAPDSTSQIIIIEGTSVVDTPSKPFSNQTPQLVVSYGVDVSNFEDEPLLVRVHVQSQNGTVNPMPLSPFREMWAFGQGSQTLSLTVVSNTVLVDATYGIINCDASAGPFTVTMPPGASFVGESIVLNKVDATANIVTVQANGSETFAFGTSMQLQLQGDSVAIFGDH
jgi:hypothetical protein